ncbi:MAG: penicillin acylase family protein [Acidobacteriota bacterium]
MNKKLSTNRTAVVMLLSVFCLTASLFVFSATAKQNLDPSSAVKISLTSESRSSAAQQQDKTLTIPGLRDRVTVRRDERGIPHIQATNDDDLFLAQGYVTASDRLWQMDLYRRSVRGELSEIFGQATLAEDKRHRAFGFAQVLDQNVARLPPDLKRMLEAYAKGVNAFIDSARTLPPEFIILQYKPQPWRPSDSLAVGKLMGEYLSTTWQLDIMRASLASLPKEKRDALLMERTPLDVLVVGRDRQPAQNVRVSRSPIAPPMEIVKQMDEMIEDQRRSSERTGLASPFDSMQASNNWVVAGKRTTSGKPLLANDPHIPASAPGVWYMTDLSAPGLHVTGVTFPGAPGIIIGHNERIAWGVTNLGPDVQDLYLEKFDKDNPKRYMTPAGWREAEVRHEQIKARKSPIVPVTETQTYDVTVTRHGPIILEKDNNRYALRWTALDPVSIEVAGFPGVNRARNWKEFTAALSQYVGPTQNFVYADIDGNIGYYGAGRIPIRKSGDGSVPYDGGTDDGEWTGYIPFAKLPHSYNPSSGIIVTANQRITGDDYPYFLGRVWAQPYRARRIFDLLSARPKLDTQDFRLIQGDVYSIAGVGFARAAVRLLKNQPRAATDEKLRTAISSMEGWDGMLDTASRTAPLVAQMRTVFRQKVLTAALGEPLAKTYGWPNSDVLLTNVITEEKREWLPKEFSGYPELLLVCYDDARKALTKSLGEDEAKWIWGNMVKSNFQHPLAPVPFVGAPFVIPAIPQNGTSSVLSATVNVGSAVSMRLIADTSDWDKTQHGIPLGESGLPSSPHWKDQFEDWRNVTPRALPFSKAVVESATRDLLILVPAK